jgi:hypothetical protein
MQALVFLLFFESHFMYQYPVLHPSGIIVESDSAAMHIVVLYTLSFVMYTFLAIEFASEH